MADRQGGPHPGTSKAASSAVVPERLPGAEVGTELRAVGGNEKSSNQPDAADVVLGNGLQLREVFAWPT